MPTSIPPRLAESLAAGEPRPYTDSDMTRVSLSTRLLTWILPLSAALILAATLSTYWIARGVILWETQQGLAAVTEAAGAQITGFFEMRDSDLATAAQSPLLRDHYMNVEYGLRQEAEVYRRELERMLEDLAARARCYPELLYLDARGRVVVRVREGKAASPARFDAPEFFKAASASRGRIVSPMARVPWHPAPIVRYAAPLRGEDGRFRGALIFSVSMQPVNESLGRLKMGMRGRSFLTARQPGRFARELTHAGPDDLMAAAAIPGTPWSVVTLVHRSDFLGRLAWVTAAAFTLCALAAALLVLVLPLRVRHLLEPLQALESAAQSYAEGNWGTRVKVDGPREIAALAEAFNGMAQRLSTLVLAMLESEGRYRTAIENSPHAIVSLDRDFRVTLWNRRAAELFGYTEGEAQGTTLAAVLGEKAHALLRDRAKREGKIVHVELAGTTRDGRRLDLTLSMTGRDGGEPGEWFVVLQDETEKKRLQAQLIQAEKLSAVGSLIAGVAHELNNPLAAVTGFAELVARSGGRTAEETEDLRLLHQSAMRCHDIVQGLLLFARKSKPVLQRLPLNHVVQQTLSLVEYRLVRTEGIELTVDLDSSGPHVAGEFQKLQQILVNVVGNAVDALAGRVGRRAIRIRTAALRDGAELSIEDTGPGVPADLRSSIFEPFYTTKPAGKGTGLGLSVSAQIAGEFGGRLFVEDAPGGGARFVLKLPPCPEGLPEPEAVLLPPSVPGRRVLVVDDEPEVAQLVVRLLGEDGLEAAAETDPLEAIARLQREEFDLVISDADMGAVRGTRVLEAVRRLKRRPAFMFITGDLLNQTLTAELTAFNVPVLAKPFLRSDFLRFVRRALQTRPARKPAA